MAIAMPPARVAPSEEDVPAPYTEEQFQFLTAAYPDLRMERTAEGEIIIMPPAATESGGRNADLTTDLNVWNRLARTGKVFDSSSGFRLPNGAIRSPDAAWVEISRWQAMTAEQRKQFARICPDFVAELRSPTDRLSALQKKMAEYIANGARLGWLMDPGDARVEIYRPGQEVEILENPASLSGEDMLPGFTLDLTEIMQP